MSTGYLRDKAVEYVGDHVQPGELERQLSVNFDAEGIEPHSCMAISTRSGFTAPVGALGLRPNIDMISFFSEEPRA